MKTLTGKLTEIQQAEPLLLTVHSRWCRHFLTIQTFVSIGLPYSITPYGSIDLDRASISSKLTFTPVIVFNLDILCTIKEKSTGKTSLAAYD